MDESRPRDLIGYGRCRPHVNWPGGAQIAVSFVLNYEDGGEQSVADGDPHSEVYITPEIAGVAPIAGRTYIMRICSSMAAGPGFGACCGCSKSAGCRSRLWRSAWL
jgi:allantoinase